MTNLLTLVLDEENEPLPDIIDLPPLNEAVLVTAALAPMKLFLLVSNKLKEALERIDMDATDCETRPCRGKYLSSSLETKDLREAPLAVSSFFSFEISNPVKVD